MSAEQAVDESRDAPGVTPLRVLSLWYAFALSIGLLVGLPLEDVLTSRRRTVVCAGVSLAAAVVVLRRRPGFDTHVAWRVNYGVVVGLLLAVSTQLATTATDLALSPLDEPWFALPFGLAVGVAVEWHRNHRGA